MTAKCSAVNLLPIHGYMGGSMLYEVSKGKVPRLAFLAFMTVGLLAQLWIGGRIVWALTVVLLG